ncbi:MAG: hypothetical protein ACQPRH_02815 [Solitalea-like symbiont of Tyrophagus putrescentiae]
MKKKFTLKSNIAKSLVLLFIILFINSLSSSAQITIESKMPESSHIESVTTNIGGVLILNGYFDITGGLNQFPSFSLPQIDVFQKNDYNAFNMHMRLSILRMINDFKLRNGEVITTTVEGDFNGLGSMETTTAFRMRHINVRYKGWMVGQTWSTFGDTGAFINTLDADGPSIGIGFRKPVIRYTFNRNNPLKVSLALEQALIDYRLPEKEKGATDEKRTIKKANPYFPELVGAIDYTFGEHASHVRLSGVFRKISYLNLDDSTSHANSWGTSLSSRLNLNEAVSFIVQGNVGRGIGIYTSSFAGSGYDGFITDSQLKTIPAFGGFAAIEIRYAKNSPFVSTFAIGYSSFQINANNNGEITKNSFYGGTYSAAVGKVYQSDYNKLDINIPYASVNLMYKIFENFTAGAEVNWGAKNLVTKSSNTNLSKKRDSKDALRVTFGVLYSL